MFLPTTKKEMDSLGWDRLDVILVTGDSYIDSPFVGVAIVGKLLLAEGFRVGVIGQPDISGADITRLGEPRLFWGVSGGCIDSMVANRTATGRPRKSDDYTPGGVNNRRPDRASLAYANLIRRFFKNTRPIVLGGVEASLRRVAHYDFWTNSVRRSILFDAKADYLLYGMAERSIVELAGCLKDGGDPRGIRGLCYISKELPDDCIELPSYEDSAKDKDAFTRAFQIFYNNNDPATARRLSQRHDVRYLVQNPPALYLSREELDRVYGLRYERDLHPYHRKDGEVKALETIRFSISTHRGCYGECSFCAIAVHEGRRVRSRSRASVIAEAKEIVRHPLFKGRIHDVGGPSANMYASGCERMEKQGCCPKKSCISPKVCPLLHPGHAEQVSLLRELRSIDGVKKVVVASGIRHDMVLADKKDGERYLKELVCNHVSGQMKIAPEHSEAGVLQKMGKQGSNSAALIKFKELFYRFTKEAGMKQFLSYYLMAAHPGCTDGDMKKLREFALKELGTVPEQVQVFTPTPSTYSTLMYWTGRDPSTGDTCFVEKSDKGRERQKSILTGPDIMKRNDKRHTQKRWR
ncbi:MAG TPA: YgiQ family radical SAM protein [Deltaproteobacteria bacterium]|nr:MAG: YgiQ family radical SAM protein [Deltaproteobacteria bacterium GWA2_55_82]OIJ73353.1 MAG: YgiQ family radical SAM protein [Deltaproteobacteria bacterium GWC2_55_46]HBG45371.1 YgiQ family radical SAM protein [Deltaproteobacteria bacterium]HCY10202.1 YgiQ family radical SAM protein [Deltaproteobacteria bacterium]